MKLSGRSSRAAALIAGLCLSLAGSVTAQGAAAPVLGWTPKPTTLTPYTAPHKAWTKLSDVLAAHRGQASWRQEVVNDKHMIAAWVQSAPGTKTKSRMFADTRYAMIVWDGEVRVSIQGQEPFVARKGFIVQVPFRVPFTLETVGTKPSLMFEALPQTPVTIYSADETPPAAPPGTAWYKARLQGQDTYERQQAPNEPWRSKPYFDFFGSVANLPGGTKSVVRDDRMVWNIIRGQGIPRQPDTVKGHFHLDYSEFWLIAEGKISYLIEGMDYFEAEPGDVVYVPPGRFHRAQFAGSGMSTRMPINGFPSGSHHFDPDE